MADIKFQCPECWQRIAVDESAAGMQVDCPNCQSTLVIPRISEGKVEVVTQRKLVVHRNPAGSAYEELERKHKELAAALDDSARLRAESDRSRAELAKLRDDLAA